MVGAGDRDRLIEIVPQIASKGRAGAPQYTGGPAVKEWACWKIAKQETRYLNHTETLFSECTFEIPYRTDVDLAAKIRFDGITYDIVHTAEIGYREGLRIYCRAQGVKKP